MIKRLVKSALRKLGYEVHRKPAANTLVGFNPSYLARICQPQTVFDVGIGYGTYPLYEAFPSARFVLVEPLRHYRDAIEGIARKYDCDIFYKAVSDRDGFRGLKVDTKELERSSFAARTSLTKTENKLEEQEVEVTTLDKIFGEYPNLKRPILIKIDTEGHELQVLQGATSLLQITDVVIAEVSIAKRFEDSYQFEDLVLFMKEHGFYLMSFLNITQPEGELRPRFADIVFKRQEEEATAPV
ncbi:MAG: FkbM family methyltransferase [bacterium]